MQNKILAVIGVGSNIEAEENVRKAESEIRKVGELIGISTFKYTKPLLFEDQPDFLNGGFLIYTELSPEKLTKELKDIEKRMGRVKTENKNGPRTIDLDVEVYDGKVVDDDFYERDFLKETVKELLPNLKI